MKLTSSAFEHGKEMPSEYTCDGIDISPELHIENVPKNAKSLALIMDDPDAPMGTFVHWVVWNIPIDTKIIKKGAEPKGIEGKTNSGRTGYGGPCPPSGTHRYFFKVYALDMVLTLKEGSTKKDLEAAMQNHIIEKAEIMGTYGRK
ncbi:YbhB/YbcL family Raf kinase inhibitor-like protein [Candidatus Woesearchaeota archaeon]|nr:YbhB/YbcL family Raf kinase inhibitor-like protein [Candidatus Woesearchaeota archaeon]